MKQSTRDILAAVIVLWIVGAILSVVFSYEVLSIFLLGIPGVVTVLVALGLIWAGIAGRLE